MAHQSDDGNSDFMESYEPAPPAWYLLKEHIPESELPEIRGIIGGPLIDMWLDTHSEVEMLVQIWKDVCRTRGGSAEPPRPALADSPVVKDLLRAEIRLLLLSLQEKAAEEGRDEDAVMCCYSPAVVSYAMSSSGQRSRAQSAGIRPDPQEAPSRPQSAKSLQEVRSSSRLSASSNGEDRIDAVKDQLNLKDIHKVVAHLQSVLTEDLEAMMTEIQFLQECVEEKHQAHCQSLTQDPTVSELKEERKLIQKDLKLEEAACRPWPARGGSADYGLQGGHRSAGQLCDSSASAAKPPLARPPRLPVEPSLHATTRPPARVLDSSRHTQESSYRRGNELQRCGGAREQGSVPEERPPRPANSASSAARRAGSHPDRSPGPDPGGSGPTVGSHAQEEREPNSSPGLSRYSPSGSHFPTGVLHPRPPAQRQTRDDDTATLSPIGVLVPAPPAMQKPATRGQSVTRRLRLPQGGLVSPT
ncbi:hypothetical protein COCON_G00089440 [Conger conger]|uniref:Coiled-coil domain-containing protein 24 n=1 Tax=Conger conger TaxID=82655 RepID=A0A9Q1DKY2_CONCO|nr:hypothetical protein COCON_G00089440 [Conger conger]